MSKQRLRGYICKTCNREFLNDNPKCEKCLALICPSCSLHVSPKDPNYCTNCNDTTTWLGIDEV